MKGLFFKLILFLSPFIVFIGVELFVLPVDFFTFRTWEALVVVKLKTLLPGPFYPGMELSRIEEGDLGHHTEYSVRKEVTWKIDHDGYRTSASAADRPRVVIVGDSNTVGSGLTQRAILSEVLAEKVKKVVYPFAPVSINSFFKERRFMENPPEVVIFEGVERDLVRLSRLKETRGMRSVLRQRLLENEAIQSAAVLMDRLWKMNMLHFFRAEIRRAEIPSPRVVMVEGAPVLFLEGAKANVEIPDPERGEVVRTLCSYREGFRKKGIRFIFLPIPNKETIYHRYLAGGRRPVFLERLISELDENGVETVDTQKAFDEAFRRGVPLYLRDDTHWSAEAVQIAAGLIAERIGQRKD